MKYADEAEREYTKDDQDPYTLGGTLKVRCHCGEECLVTLTLQDQMKGECGNCGTTFQGIFYCFYKEVKEPPPDGGELYDQLSDILGL